MGVDRRIASFLSFVMFAVVVGATGGAAAAAPAVRLAPSTQRQAALYPGQTLEAKTKDDSLWSGQFQLQVTSENVTLWQIAVMHGPHYPDTWSTNVWGDGDRNGHFYKGNSVLRMQRDGDLVLRTQQHKVIWRTGTRGRHNHLQLRRSGGLVVENGAGRVLWSAHSHPELLGDGDTLVPGGILGTRPSGGRGGPFVRLLMQRGGNVVLQCNGSPEWSTHTHRPGSTLSLQRNGNLVVRGPQGAVLWRSHSRSHTPYSVFDGPALEITNDRLHIVWAGRPRRSPCDPYA